MKNLPVFGLQVQGKDSHIPFVFGIKNVPDLLSGLITPVIHYFSWPGYANQGCFLGVPPACCGDECFHAAHRTSSIRMEAQAFHLYLRESADSEIAIWHEGQWFIYYTLKLC